jgi:glycosyltransferase involved in cell wall biosynthesis
VTPAAQDTSLTISIVVPMFNEEDNVPVLLERLRTLEQSLNPIRVEFVFVDDCSRDRTYEQLRKFSYLLQHVRLLKLAKNAGSHAAIMCGLLESTGDCAIFMAGDLQDPPELLLGMVKEWHAGFGIVWAARKQIAGVALKDKAFSHGYWGIANFVSGAQFPAWGVDFALIDRKVIDCITPLAHQDVPLFLLIAETGFNSTTVFYEKAKRGGGRSGWTLRKKLRLVNHTLLYSIKPIRILLMVCLVFAGLSIVASAANLALSGMFINIADITAFISSCSTFFGLLLFGAVTEFFARHLKALGALPRFIINRKDVIHTPASIAESSQDEILALPVISAPSPVQTL